MRDGFAGGLAVGVIATLVLCWLFDPRLGPIFEAEFVSIFAIVATLVAAAVAYGGILRQIAHQNALERNRRLAELEAERAALPLALSRMMGISRRKIQDIVGHDEVVIGLEEESTDFEVTHLESIKAMIKVADEPVRHRLHAILRGYQVAAGRWKFTAPLSKTPEEQSGDGYNRIWISYRWALVHALCESLLDFSRGAAPDFDGDFPNERMMSALVLSGVLADRYTDFKEAFERKIETDAKKPITELFI